MTQGKFICVGKTENKIIIQRVKNILSSGDYTYLGHVEEPSKLVRFVRQVCPDIIIIDLMNNFNDFLQSLEIIDTEMLAACILLLDSKPSNIMDFIKGSKIINYASKPIQEESILQMVDFITLYYKRLLDYEKKIKQLNETIENRKIIEKAKWILVNNDKVSEGEAYNIIMKKSRDNRMPMHKVAEAIIIARG